MSQKLTQVVPSGEYMGPEQIAFFKALLLDKKKETLAKIEEARVAMSETSKAMPDQVDTASNEADRAMTLRLVERDRMVLKDIDRALTRIAEGEYGYCESFGIEIGIDRLLISPTAAFCTEAMRQNEATSRHYIR